MTDAFLARIEDDRSDVIFSLGTTWSPADVCEPVDYYLAIARAPSPTKDALSLGLIEGQLKPHGHGLCGTLSLTALGRLAARRFHWAMRKAGA